MGIVFTYLFYSTCIVFFIWVVALTLDTFSFYTLCPLYFGHFGQKISFLTILSHIS